MDNSMNNKSIGNMIFYFFITIFAIIWMIPVIFMVFTAVKSPGELFQSSLFAIPKGINWGNFVAAWKVGQMGDYTINSLLVACIKVPAGIAVEALAAYALTKMALKRNLAIFLFFLVGMMIPVQATLVPLNIMLKNMHLINTHLGLGLVYIGFGIPFGILVLRGFFRTIPRELNEAAMMDGCSDFKILWKIIIPIAKPAIATLIILDFLSTWNEFTLASVLITKDVLRTIPSGIMAFRGQHSMDYSLLNAGVLISLIPVLIVYIAFQKYFVTGLSGSVKG